MTDPPSVRLFDLFGTRKEKKRKKKKERKKFKKKESNQREHIESAYAVANRNFNFVLDVGWLTFLAHLTFPGQSLLLAEHCVLEAPSLT